MEVKILSEGKDFIKIELIGETHTLANALRNELNNDSSVNVAGYTKDHPLVGNPVLLVKTDGKKDVKKILMGAVDRLKKKNFELLSLIKKI